MQLRDYQNYAVNSIWRYFEDGNKGHPLVAAPTGVGKSLIIGGFTQQAVTRYPATRVMVLAHVKELIEQNFDKLIRMWPSAPAGIYSAGVGRKDTHAKITFAGIQSAKNAREMFGHQDLLLVDEAHLVSAKETTDYRKFIQGLMDVNPALRVVGLTATPYRMGQGMLTDGGLFTDICCDMTTLEAFNWFFDQGYLVRLIPKRTTTFIDTSEVHIRGGEFVANELQLASSKEEITYKALMETMAYGHDRKHWLIFVTGIDHAKSVQKMLQSFGILSAVVSNESTKDQRREGIAGFKAGKYRALINNNVLTTGFDFAGIDLICMLRPTNSPGLWVQMLGRGTRPDYAPGFDLSTMLGRLTAISASAKPDCLVLDFGRNTERLGPINDPRIPQKKGSKGGVAPIKICEWCGTYNHSSARECICCHSAFPVHIKFGAMAGTAELIASGKKSQPDPIVEVFKVDKVVYSNHIKAGRPDSIRMLFYCGLRRFSSYLCLEHGGYATKWARDYWRDAWSGEEGYVPETTVEAIKVTDKLKAPVNIRVWTNARHPEIKAYDFTGTAFSQPNATTENDLIKASS